MRDRRGLRVDGCVASVPPEGRYHSRVTPALCEETPGVSPSDEALSVFTVSVIGSERNGATKPSFLRKLGEPGWICIGLKSVLPEKGSLGIFCAQGYAWRRTRSVKTPPRVGDL